MEDWFRAIENNDIKKVNNLLNQGIDVNIQNNFGYTALMLTALMRHNELFIKILKQTNIDINIQSKAGWDAISFASYYNHLNMVKSLIIKPNIDITHKNYEDDFSFIDYLDTSILKDYFTQKIIIKNGRDDIILFFDKYNLVHKKIKKENPEIFQALEWGLI
jgi:ankyrin repeat protein